MIQILITAALASVYIAGVCLNLILLLKSCKKIRSKEVDNTNYLIITTALFSAIAIASTLGLIVVEYMPQTAFCSILPVTYSFSLSFAFLTLTVYTVVKHAQLTSTWKLRINTAMLIIVLGLVMTMVLDLPIFYYAVKNTPIIIYDAPGCRGIFSDVVDTKINFVSHIFMRIVLQLVIPCIITTNRMILVCYYQWTTEKTTTTGTKDKQYEQMIPKYSVVKLWANIISQLLFIGFVFVFAGKAQDSHEAFNFLDDVSQKLSTLAMCFLYINIYLLGVFEKKKSGDNSEGWLPLLDSKDRNTKASMQYTELSQVNGAKIAILPK